MIKKLMITGTIAAAFLSASVFADTNMGGDRATDGADSAPGISADTAKEGHPKFDELDRNRDGQLSEDELHAWGASAAGGSSDDTSHGERMMRDYDKDDDGFVSRDELHEGHPKGMEDDY